MVVIPTVQNAVKQCMFQSGTRRIPVEKINKLFGQPGEAERVLAAAKDKEPIKGQTMSQAQLEKAERLRMEQAANIDTTAAAEFTKEIIVYLNQRWIELNFTPEQRIFSLALATIHLRECIPEKFPDETPGGKDMFDRVCVSAREYYDSHKD
jgi:sulfur relay (sulfurtransferase) DsrC/TusE family protein